MQSSCTFMMAILVGPGCVASSSQETPVWHLQVQQQQECKGQHSWQQQPHQQYKVQHTCHGSSTGSTSNNCCSSQTVCISNCSISRTARMQQLLQLLLLPPLGMIDVLRQCYPSGSALYPERNRGGFKKRSLFTCWNTVLTRGNRVDQYGCRPDFVLVGDATQYRQQLQQPKAASRGSLRSTTRMQQLLQQQQSEVVAGLPFSSYVSEAYIHRESNISDHAAVQVTLSLPPEAAALLSSSSRKGIHSTVPLYPPALSIKYLADPAAAAAAAKSTANQLEQLADQISQCGGDPRQILKTLDSCCTMHVLTRNVIDELMLKATRNTSFREAAKQKRQQAAQQQQQQQGQAGLTSTSSGGRNGEQLGAAMQETIARARLLYPDKLPSQPSLKVALQLALLQAMQKCIQATSNGSAAAAAAAQAGQRPTGPACPVANNAGHPIHESTDAAIAAVGAAATAYILCSLDDPVAPEPVTAPAAMADQLVLHEQFKGLSASDPMSDNRDSTNALLPVLDKPQAGNTAAALENTSAAILLPAGTPAGCAAVCTAASAGAKRVTDLNQRVAVDTAGSSNSCVGMGWGQYSRGSQDGFKRRVVMTAAPAPASAAGALLEKCGSGEAAVEGEVTDAMHVMSA